MICSVFTDFVYRTLLPPTINIYGFSQSFSLPAWPPPPSSRKAFSGHSLSTLSHAGQGSLHLTPSLCWVSTLHVGLFCSAPSLLLPTSLTWSLLMLLEQPPPTLNSLAVHSVNFFSLSAKWALLPPYPETSLISPRKDRPPGRTSPQHSKRNFIWGLLFVCLLCSLTFKASLGCGEGRRISSAAAKGRSTTVYLASTLHRL